MYSGRPSAGSYFSATDDVIIMSLAHVRRSGCSWVWWPWSSLPACNALSMRASVTLVHARRLVDLLDDGLEAARVVLERAQMRALLQHFEV